jgi:hypothetical protein
MAQTPANRNLTLHTIPRVTAIVLPALSRITFLHHQKKIMRKHTAPTLYRQALLLYTMRRLLTALAVFCCCLFLSFSTFAQTQVTYTSNGTFTVPTGVTQITVECWGAGGGGAGSGTNNATHRGGGGGAYAASVLSVIPGSTFTVIVGTGGVGGVAANGTGGTGSPSTFGVGPLVRAAGGSGGLAISAGAGGAGGTVAGSIGDTRYRGGNAVAGGGGGAGSTGQGGDADGNNGGLGTALYGGNGGTAPTGGAPGVPGLIYGGGGSGGRRSGPTHQPGGAGANGQVIVTFDCPDATITYTGSPWCTSEGPQSITITGSLGGTFSAVPAGLTINTSTGLITPSTSTPGTYTVTYFIPGAYGCADVNATTSVTINALPTVNCDAVNNDPVCVNAASFAFAGATPAGGTYTGPGISGGIFNPSAAGAGTHTISYTYTDVNGCTNTCTFTITVNPLPVVTCPANMSVCIDAAVFALTGATPAGGTYTGTGVSGGNFDPSVAGVGLHMITYTYQDPVTQCENSCAFEITVNPLPTVTCPSDFDICVDDDPVTLSGATPGGGTYTGAGVSGGIFNPSTAGVGTHIITYNYQHPVTTLCKHLCF